MTLLMRVGISWLGRVYSKVLVWPNVSSDYLSSASTERSAVDLENLRHHRAGLESSSLEAYAKPAYCGLASLRLEIVMRKLATRGPVNGQRLSLIDRNEVTKPIFPIGEKPLRYHRMSGLSDEQLDELESRVGELLEQPVE
jgi:hypothetical protein